MTEANNNKFWLEDKSKISQKKNVLWIKEAIQAYQFSEGIKSKLIITTRLIEETSKLKNEQLQLEGARKLMLCFLDALYQEMGYACNVSGLFYSGFERASEKVKEATGRMQLQEYSEASRCIVEALSLTTACAQRAAEELKEVGLW